MKRSRNARKSVENESVIESLEDKLRIVKERFDIFEDELTEVQDGRDGSEGMLKNSEKVKLEAGVETFAPQVDDVLTKKTANSELMRKVLCTGSLRRC